MPNSPEAIRVAIEQAATPGFRGRLIARGQARAMIWRDGILSPDAPDFSPQLSYDLKGYAYSLFELGLRTRDLDGDPTVARLAFEQAASALESVIAKGNRDEAERDFHFVMAAAAYHLAHLADGRYYVPFDHETQLAEVIVGDRSELTRADIVDALGDLGSGVDVFKARLAFQSYRVVRQRLASKWK